MYLTVGHASFMHVSRNQFTVDAHGDGEEEC